MRTESRVADARWACNRKKAYPDQKTAAKVARRINREKGTDLVDYGCGHCGRYHIGARTGEQG